MAKVTHKSIIYRIFYVHLSYILTTESGTFSPKNTALIRMSTNNFTDTSSANLELIPGILTKWIKNYRVNNLSIRMIALEIYASRSNLIKSQSDPSTTSQRFLPNFGQYLWILAQVQQTINVKQKFRSLAYLLNFTSTIRHTLTFSQTPESSTLTSQNPHSLSQVKMPTILNLIF